MSGEAARKRHTPSIVREKLCTNYASWLKTLHFWTVGQPGRAILSGQPVSLHSPFVPGNRFRLGSQSASAHFPTGGQRA
ncbi:hypothetical protein SAMN04488058_11063 [Deinococcus reticulitermitis]|uniref:Uncharacterized protein n=1 Tax=Deinococcus reticulitermitis TaxID=856736 RepID=A0A1H6ZP65_9DEIO|nr:hypothetical protein SAMN04488058_11063 [Deinococcus reticulitermitis]